jgi:hypothetical protein
MNAFQVLLGEFWAEKNLIFLVVSSERLILWRSEIVGGISNETSVLLDQSSLAEQMKGLSFGSGTQFCFHDFFILQRKAISRRGLGGRDLSCRFSISSYLKEVHSP